MRLAGIAVALALAASGLTASAQQTPNPGVHPSSHPSGGHPSTSGHTPQPYHPTYRTTSPTYHTMAPTYHTRTMAPTYHTMAPTYHTMAPTYHTMAPTYRHTSPPTYHTMAPTYHTMAPTYRHTTAPTYHTSRPSYPSSHTTRTTYGGARLRSSSWVHGVTSYHASRYHTTINITFAAHPTRYPRARWSYYNGHRWWNGYWHNYWVNQDWMWWNGQYGFWLDYDGIEVFVYEYSPGVCYFWNGYQWAPWYDPPWTPYYCPY